jgi:hypothetical protein
MYDVPAMTLRELLEALENTMSSVSTLDDDEQAEYYGPALAELRTLVAKLASIDALA